ncbi:hypothetical protein [Deinococcus humi]|uniref:Lipoprotein n=1 Tax=Deinococcus humi TaxID=662880 RepID=A0A7W8K0E7_9DEIO|nr:hypothetical protein [Deinococcus humi]MBB5365141.1 hypothetical protein [Deinococcus humi]GGO37818.1 hypothetical protein GCM10008949_43500 [Deinococcus humi]
MNRVRLALSVLALGCSLASCAPSMTSPGGQPLQTVRGEAFISAHTIALAELNAQTPADVYVTFPDCTGVAVLVADVRSFGPAVADEACKRAAAAGPSAGKYILIGASGAVLGFVAFLALVRLYVGSIS